MDSKRVKIIAGEIIMVAAELRTLSPDSLRHVYQDVGPKRWQHLAEALASAKTTSVK